MQIMEITPAIATKMLEKNLINRPVSQVTVKKYANFMQQGLWHLNGDTIKLTKSGCLIDGQHRLYAIIKANKPTVTYIITDLEDSRAHEIFGTLDQGKTRSVGDILSCNKIANGSSMASSGRMLYWLGNSNIVGRAGCSILSIPKYQLAEFILENNAFLHTAVNKIQTLYKKSRIASITFPAGFYAYLLKSNYSVVKIDDFFETFYLGKGGVNEAPNTLRHFIQKNKIEKMNHYEHYLRVFMIKAWNAFVKNQTLKINFKQMEDLLFYPEIDIRS